MRIKGRASKGILAFLRMGLPIFAFALAGCATGTSRERPPEEIKPAKVENIKVRSFGGEMTIVQVINSTPAAYTAFSLTNPPRIVLYVRAEPDAALPKATQVNDQNVNVIRPERGKAQEKSTRVVVELEREVDYTLDKEDRVITLTLLPKMAAAEADLKRERVLSSAEIEETKTPPAEPRIFFEPGPSHLNQVLGVDFTMLEHGKSRLTVTMDKKTRYDLIQRDPKNLRLTLEKTTIPPLLLRRLDSSHFEGAVDLVKPAFSPSENRLSLDISLREMVPYHVDQTDREIHIDFAASSVKPPEKKIIPLEVVKSEKGTSEAPAPQVPAEKIVPEKEVVSPAEEVPARAGASPEIASIPQGQGPLSTSPVSPYSHTSWQQPPRAAQVPGPLSGLSSGTYTGARMTMDFVNADVTNILRLIGEVSNLNIIWGTDVKGTVSMRLKNVPWDQALDLVLRNNDLAMKPQGNVIWVTTRAHMAEIEQLEQRKQEALEAARRRQLEERQKAKELEPLVTEYFPLDFAKAAEIKEHIVPPERGNIRVDERTNTIIMTDIAANIEEARKIVKKFDTPVKQIMIEARIVDASSNFSRDLGVQWNSFEHQWQKRTGMNWNDNPETYTTPGDMLFGGSFETNSPDGWAGNIGLTLARLTNRGLGTLTLDASLALAETEDKAKIISAPKVIAREGSEATISRGDQIIIPATENVESTTLDATLSLTVTPTKVSFNNYITLEVNVTDDQAPSTSRILKKSIKTTLLVKSGDTVVLGGIYKESKGKNESGIPWVKNIPLIGWAFNAKQEKDERTELLIFLTPTVLPSPAEQV